MPIQLHFNSQTGTMNIFSAIIRLLLYISVNAQLRTNFEINEVEPCGPNMNPIKLLHINTTKEADRQYLNFDMISRIPLDENVASNFLIEQNMNGDIVELFTIRSNNACKAANKYMGEFWYDIQRSSQMAVAVCPILAGHYYAHHHLLDFKKLSLQTFPFGKLQFKLTWIDNRNHQQLLCLRINIKNSFFN